MKKRLRYVLEEGKIKGNYSYVNSFTSLFVAVLAFRNYDLLVNHKKRLRLTWDELVLVRKRATMADTNAGRWVHTREWVLKSIPLMFERKNSIGGIDGGEAQDMG